MPKETDVLKLVTTSREAIAQAKRISQKIRERWDLGDSRASSVVQGTPGPNATTQGNTSSGSRLADLTKTIEKRNAEHVSNPEDTIFVPTDVGRKLPESSTTVYSQYSTLGCYAPFAVAVAATIVNFAIGCATASYIPPAECIHLLVALLGVFGLLTAHEQDAWKPKESAQAASWLTLPIGGMALAPFLLRSGAAFEGSIPHTVLIGISALACLAAIGVRIHDRFYGPDSPGARNPDYFGAG